MTLKMKPTPISQTRTDKISFISNDVKDVRIHSTSQQIQQSLYLFHRQTMLKKQLNPLSTVHLCTLQFSISLSKFYQRNKKNASEYFAKNIEY